MQEYQGNLLFAASYLINFSGFAHRVALDQQNLQGSIDAEERSEDDEYTSFEINY